MQRWETLFINVQVQMICFFFIILNYKGNSLFCFVWFFVPLEKFPLIWRRRQHCLWSAENFDFCSAPMAVKQWGFFSVPHLLWHGVSIYNGHLWEPVTLTPIAERLAMEPSLPGLNGLGLSRLGFEHAAFRLRANALSHCATAANLRNSSYQ